MEFIHQFQKIRDSLDKEYQFPFSEKFTSFDFQKIKWSDARTENFCVILRELVNHAPCSVGDMVDTEGHLRNKKERKKRWDTYNRLISGDQESVPNLIEKNLVMEYDPEKTSRPAKYCLTLFGVFYAIHLFSKRGSLRALNNLAITHKHLLPLIFDRWNVLKRTVGGEIRSLVLLADSDERIFSADSDALLNSRALRLPSTYSRDLFADEIALWFYGRLSSATPKRFSALMSHDVGISEWYSMCLKNLELVSREGSYRIRFVKALMKGDAKVGKQMLEKINSIQSVA